MYSNLKNWIFRKDHVWLQTIKYVGCGGIAVLVDQIVFYGLAWKTLPALRATDPVVIFLANFGLVGASPAEHEIERNYWLIKLVCFVTANAVVYLLNRKFVFEPGRHKNLVEVLLFFAVSLLQFIWIGLGGILITRLDWEVTYANFFIIVLGAITNFLLRKFMVFKR